jgi:hydrogenase-4 component F
MLAYSSIENMGIIAIATSLGAGAYFALLIHLIGHSLIKASYFLTAGNILEIFQSKKIKSVRALGHVDRKTTWLWITSFLGICAFPPSMLFISEFLIAKELIVQKKYLLCILFLFLLTIILFAMARVVFAMLFDEKNEERFERAKRNMSKMHNLMYYPQAILLIIAFVLGIYIPKFLEEIMRNTIVG